MSVYGIYFLHIPKTAGTAVKHWLRAHGLPTRGPRHWGQHLNMRAEVFGGHFGVDLYPLLGDREVRTFTFLRDPVEQVLSYYTYVRFETGHPYYEIAASCTLEQWLDHDVTGYMGRNFQTRYLLPTRDGPPKPTRDGKHTTERHLEWERAPRVGGRDEAIAFLNTVEFVGTTERLDDDLEKLAVLLGLEAYVQAEQVNVSRGTRPPVSASLLARIEEQNQLDRELHTLATKGALPWS